MIETARLLLRPYQAQDRADLRALWADPVVTADLGGMRAADAADALVGRHEGYRQEQGLGFWVTRRRDDGGFVGWCGLKPGNPQTPIAGELEIGWALARDVWGHGFATEAAQASLAWAWANRPEPRVVAITSANNAASRRVMDRIGLHHVASFDHAAYPPGDPARAYVTYAIDRPA